MADIVNTQRKQESEHINCDEPYELDYWTEALAVCPDRLRELVARHGPLVADLRLALKRREAGRTAGRTRVGLYEKPSF